MQLSTAKYFHIITLLSDPSRNWPFGRWYCTVNNFIAFLSVAVSVFTLMALSIDRYIAIVYPLKPRMSKVIVETKRALVRNERSTYIMMKLSPKRQTNSTEFRLHQPIVPKFVQIVIVINHS